MGKKVLHAMALTTPLTSPATAVNGQHKQCMDYLEPWWRRGVRLQKKHPTSSPTSLTERFASPLSYPTRRVMADEKALLDGLVYH